jgi:hypothetical protein
MPAGGGKAPWKTGKKALKAKGAGIDFKVRHRCLHLVRSFWGLVNVGV